MRTMRSLIPVLLLGTLVAACGVTGTRADRSGRNVLTRADVEGSQQTTAYEVIRQERPTWLRVRGPNSFTAMNPIVVYVDGMRHGDVDVLETIPTLVVQRIRFYTGPEAQSRFGLNHTNGAIEVTTRSQ